jgi:hypothetical protein
MLSFNYFVRTLVLFLLFIKWFWCCGDLPHSLCSKKE